ncbi:hypothetical protein MPH47_09795 [Psychrobacillus psychrodurans]|uniref:hypothetical protein n=1 Tax=Psychrobacillus psychrodurans TaxID=126157 RepID=UPI001F4E96C3|nr:hypothetical protein [Psychrobacillus psychrodurans]MCK1997509.1 hypothetical protein [Psychrobacillus psychrodurans]
MELILDKKEFQLISAEFRRIASRLLKTNMNDGINNLKRFIFFIENNPLINNFIQEHNTLTFDIEKEIQNREMYEGYLIQPDKKYEISFIYQLLKHCSDNCSEYISICYFYGSSRNFQDMVDAFNDRVVSMLVGHIEVFLKGIWLDMADNDKFHINVNGGQVSIAQGQGTVNATQNNYFGEIQALKELAEKFNILIDQVDIDKETLADTREIVEIALAEVISDSPKRSILKHAIEKIEYVGKLGTGLNGLNNVTHSLIEQLSKFI